MPLRSRFNDQNLQRCYDEGMQAAKERKHFNDWCPYTFDHCDKCDADGNIVFDRRKMDEWFNGWSEQLRSEGLGYNFKPKKSSASLDICSGKIAQPPTGAGGC